MRESNGGLGHNDILDLPFSVFLGYIESINEMHEQRENTDYFNGSKKLANEWNKNKDKWVDKKRVM